MSKAAIAVIGLGAIGFLVGFMWGQGTRSSLPGATQTSFNGGVLTVKVDARQAVENGLMSVLGS